MFGCLSKDIHLPGGELSLVLRLVKKQLAKMCVCVWEDDDSSHNHLTQLKFARPLFPRRVALRQLSPK